MPSKLKKVLLTFFGYHTPLKMPAVPRKISDAPCKMSATQGIMSAATHLMSAKDQRGATPIHEKNLVSRNDFYDIRGKNKNPGS